MRVSKDMPVFPQRSAQTLPGLNSGCCPITPGEFFGTVPAHNIHTIKYSIRCLRKAYTWSKIHTVNCSIRHLRTTHRIRSSNNACRPHTQGLEKGQARQVMSSESLFQSQLSTQHSKSASFKIWLTCMVWRFEMLTDIPVSEGVGDTTRLREYISTSNSLTSWCMDGYKGMEFLPVYIIRGWNRGMDEW